MKLQINQQVAIRKPKVGIIAEGTVTALTSHGAYVKGESIPNDGCTQGKVPFGSEWFPFVSPNLTLIKI